ncbi:MAG: helix-hairpin-helix domain-containing protein [Bacteroidota bacterium]
MRWIYRAQTRLGLTGPEGTAALVLLVAFAGGGMAYHLQASAEPVPPDVYAASDDAFAAAAEAHAHGATSTDAPEALALFAAPGAPVSAPEADASTPASPEAAVDVAEAEVQAAAAPRRATKPPPAPTNINTASEQDLQRLPRIGPALAARIVAHRNTHGPFRHPDEIVEVRGIGERTLEKLRPWIHL